VLAGSQAVTMPLGELLTLWYGEYLLLWQPAAATAGCMARNATGTDVLWLRRTLGELRGSPVLAGRLETLRRLAGGGGA
jgi:general secretion pathway protein A